MTIDPVDARDFDDAISLVRLDNGHWRLGVHIADVAHFVRPKTALDREARQRATSVYLPDRVIPMLPEMISNGLASLQPGKVRYTKTAFLEFTADGLRMAAELHSAAIRSRKRLTYEQVDGSSPIRGTLRRKLGPAVCELLGRMRELAAILRRRRMARGALELAMPEVKIDLDKQGPGHRGPRGGEHRKPPDHRGVHARGQRGGGRAAPRPGTSVPAPHPRPAVPRKLRALTEFVAELGLPRPRPRKPLRAAKAAGDCGRPARAARRPLRRAAVDVRGRSTARRKKGTTPWPARAIATSLRRSAATRI